jgi:hypothetical protein
VAGGPESFPLTQATDQFWRLAVRWERRLDIHQGFLALACAVKPHSLQAAGPTWKSVNCERATE